jgi:hypothetical protein
MRVAVVGSRSFEDFALVCRTLDAMDIAAMTTAIFHLRCIVHSFFHTFFVLLNQFTWQVWHELPSCPGHAEMR